MGMWDLRCMVTGLPLTANDPATAILLTSAEDSYRPATLGLRGIYNCYGTIDGVVEDVNAGLIWTYATERLADGRLAVRADESLEPTDPVDQLLQVVERNELSFGDDPVETEPALTLDGEAIRYALIYQPVWDALSASTPKDQAPADGLFERLFGESTIAREIYQTRLAEVAPLVRQLAAVDAFLAARDQHWAPPGEERQRYPVSLGASFAVTELRMFVEEARRDFADVDTLRAAIDQADRAVREHEDEDEAPPTDWSAPAIAALTTLTSLEVKRAIAVDEDGNPL